MVNGTQKVGYVQKQSPLSRKSGTHVLFTPEAESLAKTFTTEEALTKYAGRKGITLKYSTAQ